MMSFSNLEHFLKKRIGILTYYIYLTYIHFELKISNEKSLVKNLKRKLLNLKSRMKYLIVK